MALSGLDIYKLLPKTNCRQCGFATCLAFAMQLAKKAVSIDKCPPISAEAKQALEAASLPPIKLVTVGSGEAEFAVGNETVMFRHEEKFHHPCALGFIIDDNLNDAGIKEKLGQISRLNFERVGQELKVNLVVLYQTGAAARFAQAAKLVADNTELALGLSGADVASLKQALAAVGEKKPLVACDKMSDLAGLAGLAKEFSLPLVAKASSLDELSALTAELNKQGVQDIIIDTGAKPIAEKIWDLTQARRQALKRANRSLGYPFLVNAANDDPLIEVQEAAAYIVKYASIVLIRGTEPWEALALLTLRQNIYSDPQKPLQIEPGLYPVGNPDKNSPLLVTTNFSLSYYTVLGETEASKIPSYILAVDTEGMSVLTAWAAEKFTSQKIAASMDKFGTAQALAHKKVVIPGYVAVLSGELEEQSGWKVIVGPKEAAGIPSFLKNFS